MLVDSFFYLICIIFILISFSWILRIVFSYHWIKKSKDIINVNHNRQIYIIIPVLSEVKRITSTVRYLLKVFNNYSNMSINIVSTEKEYLINPKGKNTIDIVKQLTKKHKKIVHFHYPHKDGKMAHQLNFAIKEILKKENVSKDALFVIYNADSKPHKKTFDWVCSEKNKNYEVFQQYGSYFKNIKISKKGIIPLSAASWQTRWSLGFEIYHALLQFLFKSEDSNNIIKDILYPLNYCIGHGFFFTKNIFKELGGFSEDTHNEDAIVGLELSYLRKKIVPIPYFEEADSPDGIKGLFIQKSNWFFGPFDSFKYLRKIINKRGIKEKAKLFRLSIQSIKLFSHAIYWVFGPTFLTLLFIILITHFSLHKLLFFMITILSFLCVPNYMSWYITQSRKLDKSIWVFLMNLIGRPFTYFLHGASAYKTIVDVILSKLTGRGIEKKKTPMLEEL